MMNYARFLKLAAMSIMLSHGAAAQNHDHDHNHDHERRGHGAHVHGTGTLNLAIESNEIEIELISPGHDLVGFEHAPESSEDRAAVEKAIAELRKGGGLFVFPAEAGCRLEEAKVETGMTGQGAHGSGHEEGHAHGHEHGHEHDHEKDHAVHRETHAEFHAHYHFHCATPARATHVDVKLFERFPGIEKLNARVISPSGQSARELTPAAARLEF